jgi:hypothetical protein
VEVAMRARITVSVRPDGYFEIYVNEAGRELLIKELEGLNQRRDHFHLDHYDDADIADATDVALSPIPYRADDRVLLNGRVLFRLDEWDVKYFPHVMTEPDNEVR